VTKGLETAGVSAGKMDLGWEQEWGKTLASRSAARMGLLLGSRWAPRLVLGPEHCWGAEWEERSVLALAEELVAGWAGAKATRWVISNGLLGRENLKERESGRP
jgi:hypothetical protein